MSPFFYVDLNSNWIQSTCEKRWNSCLHPHHEPQLFALFKECLLLEHTHYLLWVGSKSASSLIRQNIISYDNPLWLCRAFTNLRDYSCVSISRENRKCEKIIFPPSFSTLAWGLATETSGVPTTSSGPGRFITAWWLEPPSPESDCVQALALQLAVVWAWKMI